MEKTVEFRLDTFKKSLVEMIESEKKCQSDWDQGRVHGLNFILDFVDLFVADNPKTGIKK